MSGTVKRLSSLEIDEVSLVDRPANQHGLVTITKRDEGAGMSGLFNAQGQEVDEDSLKSGDVVYDADGTPIQLFSDEDLQGLLDAGQITEDDLYEPQAEVEPEDEPQLALVGKRGGGGAAVTGGTHSTVIQAGRNRGTRKLGVGRGRRTFGKADDNAPSLGAEVLEQLSKALTDNDQHQVISKVAERLEGAERIAKAAQARAAALEEAAERREFTEFGKSFGLPVDEDEFGGLLQAVSKALTQEQIDLFQRILNTAAAAVDLEERGSAGQAPAVLGYVDEAAMEMVGKSGGELTPEQASTALYSVNDELYLDYLSTQRG